MGDFNENAASKRNFRPYFHRERKKKNISKNKLQKYEHFVAVDDCYGNGAGAKTYLLNHINV